MGCLQLTYEDNFLEENHLNVWKNSEKIACEEPSEIGFRKDHLGNVHLVLSDLLPEDNTDFSNVQAAYEYYPFGMAMQTFESSDYRYGFNGQEKDNEWNGDGNSYDFGARIYDSRLGRWYAIDPMFRKFPDKSPYNGIGNNPVVFFDSEGEENVIYLVIAKDENGVSAISKEDAISIATEANVKFKAMGLKTRVALFKYDSDAGIRKEFIDDTDAIAILGKDKTTTVDYIRTNIDNPIAFAERNLPEDKKTDKISDFISLETQFNGAESSQNFPNEAPDGTKGGSIIAMRLDVITQYGRDLNKSDWIKTAAFTIIHGAGHNAGIGHEKNGIMRSGNSVVSSMKAGELESLETLTVEEVVNDSKYETKMKERFGDKEAKVTYEDNK